MTGGNEKYFSDHVIKRRSAEQTLVTTLVGEAMQRF
jgi:hypothetical protein